MFVFFSLCVCVHVHPCMCVCVADCVAPPVQGIEVKREVFRLSGGEYRLTLIRTNEICVCVVSGL